MWFKTQKMQKVYKEALLPILALHLPLSYLPQRYFLYLYKSIQEIFLSFSFYTKEYTQENNVSHTLFCTYFPSCILKLSHIKPYSASSTFLKFKVFCYMDVPNVFNQFLLTGIKVVFRTLLSQRRLQDEPCINAILHGRVTWRKISRCGIAKHIGLPF